MSSPEPVLRSAVTGVFGEVNGVGVDVVDIALMRELVETGGTHFVDAYWSTAEQAAVGGSVEGLAGRWAAKEAVMKSLGTGIGNVDPADIEIVSDAAGAPSVSLRGPAAQIADAASVAKCLVSITHEADWAAAVAVAVQHEPSTPLAGGVVR